MEERILSDEEINEILNEAQDPKYKIPNLLHLGQRTTSVLRVSVNKNLILIRGNEFTGFDHILVRHSPSSKAQFWKEEKKIYLDNPSRFSLSTVPIYDFLTIAESICDQKNLITDQRNKNPHLFDLYIGLHTENKKREIEFYLFLYKNTGIIHTLYPNSKAFNKKKVLNLHQHFSSFISDEKRCIDTFYVPYYDHKSIERAKIIVRLFKATGIEKWYIQVNTNEGAGYLTHLVDERRVESYLETHFRSLSLDYQEDLSKIEKVIDRIINGKIKLD